MFYLLILFGFIAMAAGLFVLGFGFPIRETPFGAALLIAGSVAMTGGFVLLGLAAAVRELRQVAQGLKARPMGAPRPVRPPEHKEGERHDGAGRRPGPPRLPVPAAQGAEIANAIAPHLMPAKFDVPGMQSAGLGRQSGPGSSRRAMAETESAERCAEAVTAVLDNDRAGEIRRPPDEWLSGADLPRSDKAAPDVRHAQAPAVSPQNIFDTVWPSEGRKTEEALEQRIESSLDPRIRPADAGVTSGAPAPPPPLRAEQPPPILKSGVIDEMAYTLFADGSIEAQMSDGTMRFASIEDLRRHLEKHEN